MALDWNEYQKQAAMQELEQELNKIEDWQGALFRQAVREARREQAAFDAAYPLESLEREEK